MIIISAATDRSQFSSTVQHLRAACLVAQCNSAVFFPCCEEIHVTWPSVHHALLACIVNAVISTVTKQPDCTKIKLLILYAYKTVCVFSLKYSCHCRAVLTFVIPLCLYRLTYPLHSRDPRQTDSMHSKCKREIQSDRRITVTHVTASGAAVDSRQSAVDTCQRAVATGNSSPFLGRLPSMMRQATVVNVNQSSRGCMSLQMYNISDRDQTLIEASPTQV